MQVRYRRSQDLAHRGCRYQRPAADQRTAPEQRAERAEPAGRNAAPPAAPVPEPSEAPPELPATPAAPAAPTAAAAPAAPAPGVLVDRESHTASVDGRTLNLAYLEFELLAHLVAHPRRVYSREQLLYQVWEQPPVGDARTVDVHVARLRRKLGAAYRDAIVTVRRVGYAYDPGRVERR